MNDRPALRVAIVDDARDVSLLLAALLNDHGYRCVHVAPAEWRRVPWGSFDVAVVDLHLGGIDGCEVLEWLAEHAGHLRRVAISGLDERLVEVRAARLAHATIPKPFLSADLERVIDPRGR